MPFILVFRPHARTAWATAYDNEQKFVDDFLNDCFASTCHADADTETVEAMQGQSLEDQYRLAFERVGHDLHSLTRLDNKDEMFRYVTEREYCGTHNKATETVKSIAHYIGWF